MAFELDFRDICKLVKSTEDFTIKYDPDNSGCRFYSGGYEITTKINNTDYAWEFDMFPIYDIDYSNDGWEVAKTYFKSMILEYDEFDDYVHDVYDLSKEDDVYIQFKDKMLKACDVITNQIEAISEEYNFDLDSYFRDVYND